MQWSSVKDMNCSVARALSVVGERWTMLILREAFLGRRRFDEFQSGTGIARNILSSRLHALVDDGIFDREENAGADHHVEYRLTKKGLDLYPVVLADIRVHDTDRTTAEPWRLSFPGASDDMEFLDLEEKGEKGSFQAGWEAFFGGPAKGGEAPERGFYNYYPVQKAKDSATVVATFTDPRSRLPDGREQPYLVTMPYGSGKAVWLGSGETWRLRRYREAYHERFWTKLARYAGSGNLTKQNSRVVLVMGRTFVANNYVNVEAKIDGKDRKPLMLEPPADMPQLQVEPPDNLAEKGKTYPLNPKPGSPGWYAARFQVKTPGEYNLKLTVKQTGDSVPGKFLVKESNPELDNTRPDFDQLYWLASEAKVALERIPDEQLKNELRQRLVRPKLEKNSAGDEAGKDNEAPRLYFTLKNADLIPQFMTPVTLTQLNRGPLESVWDKLDRNATLPLERARFILGIVSGVLTVLVLGLGCVALVMLLTGRSPAGFIGSAFLASLVLWLFCVPVYVLLFLDKVLGWGDPAISCCLLIIAGLLGIEWMARKLLKLA